MVFQSKGDLAGKYRCPCCLDTRSLNLRGGGALDGLVQLLAAWLMHLQSRPTPGCGVAPSLEEDQKHGYADQPQKTPGSFSQVS